MLRKRFCIYFTYQSFLSLFLTFNLWFGFNFNFRYEEIMYFVAKMVGENDGKNGIGLDAFATKKRLDYVRKLADQKKKYTKQQKIQQKAYITRRKVENPALHAKKQKREEEQNKKNNEGKKKN